jgi:xylulokinase
VSFVLGVDTSTTATKALLVDRNGTVVAQASSDYDFEAPRPLWAEQDAAGWWPAAAAAIRQALDDGGVDPADVDGVGLTGQMHGLVVLDAAGRPLRKAILWNDQRTAAECDEIRERVGRERLIAITGNDALTGFTAPKLLWVRRHEPDVFAATRHVLLPKDYVRLRLTGEHATDRAGASGTQLFDVAARTWSPEILEALELPAAWFPPTHEGTEIAGRISQDAARATGLLAGTPVVAGGGDQAANAVGTGVTRPGEAALSLGTSGVVFVATDRPTIEPRGRLHAFCHAIPDAWHLMGVMLSAGGSLRWYRDTLAPMASFDELVAEAVEIPAGSEGLVFLPYLTGERTPHADPTARGAFVGLTVRHTRGHLTRAVLEGVAYGLRDALDLVAAGGVAPSGAIRASGGGMRSAKWRQIVTDVLETPLATIDTHEGAAYGAAVLAAVGAGWAVSAAALTDRWVQQLAQTEVSDDRTAYREGHERYRALYPALNG